MTTTKITRQQAAALFLLTGSVLHGLEGCALRVFSPMRARWEATNGSAVVLLQWGAGDDLHGLEPGVYTVERKDLLRRAKMPAKLWDADVDGVIPIKRDDSDKPRWPNVPYVIPSEDGQQLEPAAAAHGMTTAVLDLPSKVYRAMFSTYGLTRTVWTITMGGALQVQHWHVERDGVTIDLYMMPARLN